MDNLELIKIADQLGREFCEGHPELGLSWSQIRATSEGTDGACETLANFLAAQSTDYDERVNLLNLRDALRGNRDYIRLVEEIK